MAQPAPNDGAAVDDSGWRGGSRAALRRAPGAGAGAAATEPRGGTPAVAVARGARAAAGERRVVAAELGADAALYTHGDVTVKADVAAAVDLAIARHGRLDVLYSNAGS